MREVLLFLGFALVLALLFFRKPPDNPAGMGI